MFLPIVFLYHSINKPHKTHGSPIRSDEELALEKSAFNFFFMVVYCRLSTQRVYYKHIFLNCQRTILAILHLLEFVLGFVSWLFKPPEGTSAFTLRTVFASFLFASLKWRGEVVTSGCHGSKIFGCQETANSLKSKFALFQTSSILFSFI